MIKKISYLKTFELSQMETNTGWQAADVCLPPLLERSAHFGERPSASSRPPLRHTPVSLHLPRWELAVPSAGFYPITPA